MEKRSAMGTNNPHPAIQLTPRLVSGGRDIMATGFATAAFRNELRQPWSVGFSPHQSSGASAPSNTPTNRSAGFSPHRSSGASAPSCAPNPQSKAPS